MRYVTRKCPYCGYSKKGEQSLVGPPEVRCPSCGHTFKTGADYWSKKSIFQKLKYLFTEVPFGIIGLTIMGTVVTGLVFFAVSWLLQSYTPINAFKFFNGVIIRFLIGTAVFFFFASIIVIILQIREKPKDDEIPSWREVV